MSAQIKNWFKVKNFNLPDDLKLEKLVEIADMISNEINSRNAEITDTQILEVVNLVFADMKTAEITLDGEEKRFLAVYNAHKNTDFSKIKSIRVNCNTYYYNEEKTIITDEILKELEEIVEPIEDTFIEDIGGELVFS